MAIKQCPIQNKFILLRHLAPDCIRSIAFVQRLIFLYDLQIIHEKSYGNSIAVNTVR